MLLSASSYVQQKKFVEKDCYSYMVSISIEGSSKRNKNRNISFCERQCAPEPKTPCNESQARMTLFPTM